MEFITSKEMYTQALKLLSFEIKPAGRGYSVFVTDENGNPIRHPVRMRDFEQRLKFYLAECQTLAEHHKPHLSSDRTCISTGVLKSLVLRELIRQTHRNETEYLKKNKLKLRYKNAKSKEI